MNSPTKQIANFFWHGNEFSLYEWACISSFLKNDFKVRLWSYDSRKIPSGVELCDARSVLPESDIYKYTQNGKKNNLAAFSDMFRYALLSSNEGWWFDTDVFCLKNQALFANFNQPIVSCDKAIGVLKFNDIRYAKLIHNEAIDLALCNNNNFYWGEVGPILVTNFVKSNNLFNSLIDKEIFYPIDWPSADLVLNPAKFDIADKLCSDAMSYHIWNEIISRWAIPKNILPPKDSFLYNKFIDVAPELKEMPALPVQTLDMILNGVASQAGSGIKFHLKQIPVAIFNKINKMLA